MSLKKNVAEMAMFLTFSTIQTKVAGSTSIQTRAIYMIALFPS